LSSNCLTALLVNKILLGPLPKIFPKFVGLSFFRLLSVQETTRRSHAAEVEEMTGKCEGYSRAFHGDAEFVEESVQFFLSTFSAG